MPSEFGDIGHISFRDMRYFSKYLKEYGILGPSSRASSLDLESNTITEPMTWWRIT